MSAEQQLLEHDKTHTADKRFDNIVTVLIATVTVWVAITAYFQNYAANLSDQSRRLAQQYAIEATKREINGTIRYSYEWQGAYQTWYELDLQISAAKQNGDTDAVERYQQLQEQIIPLSKLLGPQYFNASSPYPNASKFVAESYLIESTRLSETYLAEAQVGNEMIVQITLLTVSLSLYGLSLALKGRVRWLFVIVGSGIVVFCMLWLSWSMLELIGRSQVNQDAISAYAEGVGLSYQGRYDEAIEKFSAAIQENPYYAKAYYERGLAYYSIDNLDTAILEIEKARNEGMQNDISLNWNLGWIYYLKGQYPQAIEANARILRNNTEVLGMRTNLALTYLAAGDTANALTQYDLAIQEAEKQVIDARQRNSEPSASLWLYMDAAALDLQNLIDTLEGNPKNWTQAPDKNAIGGDHSAMRDFAYEQMLRLKEVTTALEYTGQLPVNTSATTITSITVGKVTEINESGLISNFEPAQNKLIAYGEKSFDIEFEYSGATPQQLIWKVYFNGNEEQSLRKVFNQDLSQGTLWYQTFGYNYTNVFVLAQGEYFVEMYADNKLLATITFTVQ
jgi:tetratricopeptide (TPR) repeat protein